MALTKEDLLAVSTMIDEKLEPMQTEITEMKHSITGLDQRVTSLEQKVTSLEQKVTSLEQKVTSLDQKVTSLEQKVTSLEQRVTSIDLYIENELDRKIDLLIENVIPLAKRFEREAEKIERMQADIDVMKGVLKEHSKILQNIS